MRDFEKLNDSKVKKEVKQLLDSLYIKLLEDQVNSAKWTTERVLSGELDMKRFLDDQAEYLAFHDYELKQIQKIREALK